MYCPKCGDIVEKNEVYCNKCGNYTRGSREKKSINKRSILVGVLTGLGVLSVIFGFSFLINDNKGEYYFSDDTYEGEVENTISKTSTKKKGKYNSVIVYDNQYQGMTFKSLDDAIQLIEKDSISQKDACPFEIKEMEEDIIDKYGITAVNLCEMDLNFAKEIANVFKKIYDEYPTVRGYLTNLTLANASMQEGYIAAFMPMFDFATSSTSSTYPWVIKTQVLLNTSYFLNINRLESSVKGGSNSGHFPPNATIYSPVAHELGHYLSFIAMMRNYKVDSILLIDNTTEDVFYDLLEDFKDGNFSLEMIKEAYSLCKKNNGTNLQLDDWRATISAYAVAKDNNGDYIYDETIAEAFHDVYLNGDNAKDASKYVVKVLKEKLES